MSDTKFKMGDWVFDGRFVDNGDLTRSTTTTIWEVYRVPSGDQFIHVRNVFDPSITMAIYVDVARHVELVDICAFRAAADDLIQRFIKKNSE